MEENSVDAMGILSSTEGIHSAELISFLKTRRQNRLAADGQSVIQYVCLGVEPLLRLITRILRTPVNNF